MFALVVRFYLRDQEAATGFDELVEETAAKIREREPGTLVYAIHRVQDAPLSRLFYERTAESAANALGRLIDAGKPAAIALRGYVLLLAKGVEQASKCSGVPANGREHLARVLTGRVVAAATKRRCQAMLVEG